MTRHYSTILCAAVAALVALGLVMLASTSAWVSGMEDPYFFLSRQAAYAGVGLFAAIVVACLPLEWSRRCAPWAFGVVCVLLVLCYVPGVGVEIYGSKRWIRVPGIHQFQPSELAKIVVVICLASWFARWQSETRTFWRGFVLPGMIAGVPLLLIAGETDVGSALTLAITVAALLYCVGTRLLFMIPSAMAGVAAVLVYLYHNENRWDRILKWWDLENPEYALGTNMQQIRALYALGNGGAFGVGLGNGNEKFGTLTFAHIDFIFPVVGEELGLAFTLGT
ncbi:MAG TPA: FtsW/RodA/SpoVE family cell cycle protein, partial [Luteolibacter sp.]|nr:FtsW/RodA/SpoVE family cell cycle protein [Luteolibacter sp.]